MLTRQTRLDVYNGAEMTREADREWNDVHRWLDLGTRLQLLG